MDVSKYVSPLTRNLKGNSVNINLVLIIVVLFLMFPFDQMLKVNVQNRLENSFKNLMGNPIMMILSTVLVYSTYLTGDIYMFVLIMFVLHRLTLH